MVMLNDDDYKWMNGCEKRKIENNGENDEAEGM